MASVFETFPFSIFVCSVIGTKLLHLFLHVTSIPLTHFLLYLPSLFLSDVIFIAIARVLLRRERSVLSTVAYVCGFTLSVVTLAGAACEWGFFVDTGGEIQWEDAGGFARDPEGMKVLLDGLLGVVIAMLINAIIAWCLKNWLYRLAGDILAGFGNYVVSVWAYIRRKTDPRRNSDIEEGDDSSTIHSYDRDSDLDDEEQRFLGQDAEKQSEGQTPRQKPRRRYTVFAIIAILYLTLTALTRPEKPYNHLSTTYPWPILDAFHAEVDRCEEKVLLSQNEWPLPNLTSKDHWQDAHGHFKGWAPGVESKLSKAYKDYHPDWLPKPVPSGFARWDADRAKEDEFVITPGQEKNKEKPTEEANSCAINVTEDVFYNPVTDPMKITNLDNDLLGPLKDVLEGGDVKIKHVMFILMESLREELFPIQQGSGIHKFVMDTHGSEDRKEVANSRLAQLTPNSEKISGKSGNFVDSKGKLYEPAESNWEDKTRPGFGGINVVGGFTPSSVSTKSLAALHCGVWPLPVDKFEESHLEPYQPCIPQIFDLFNSQKDDKKASEDYREQEWSPAFFQATTDHYDRQFIFDDHIGFKHVVTKNVLSGKRLGGPIKEINYFGYPETVLKPYIEEYINKTLSENKRMFLSHFTSTTHHPWGLPEGYNVTRYLSLQDGGWHKDMNNYLNTVKFVDNWLGEMMNILDNYGIADETLVVFVGDHGQAFKEDTKKSGTYENGHVSNYRVPITLRHPQIPRIQYEANATSVSLLPTVLDLLINTNSLNKKDMAVASDIIHDYEGQSLIRPFKSSQEGRRQWNFGLVNSGGGMLTVTSADSPWRMVMPLGLEVSYTMSNLKEDPLEVDTVSDWTLENLLLKVETRFGHNAVEWAKEANDVTKWWVIERKRLWGYNKSK